VRFELKHARLHERGVCALPVWVVDYECLGQRWRAFVSALEPRSGRIAVAGMRHASPWADMASSSVGSPLTADGAFSWKILGQMRTDDAQTNTDWRTPAAMHTPTAQRHSAHCDAHPRVTATHRATGRHINSAPPRHITLAPPQHSTDSTAAVAWPLAWLGRCAAVLARRGEPRDARRAEAVA
jgi:hypothetical protein